jgi:hypothetical protein
MLCASSSLHRLHQSAVALFRLLGAAGRTMVIANTYGSLVLVRAAVTHGSYA